MTAARQARFDGASQHRRSLIAKVHIAKSQLRMVEDDYRAIMLRVTGNSSAAQCTDAELVALLKEFEGKGFTAKAKKPGARPADHPVARKARALWISLHQLGAIADPSDRALEAFAQRQLGVAKLQWADQALGYKLIEALKAIGNRAGWDQDLTGVRPGAQLIVLKRNLVYALFKKLRDVDAVPRAWTIDRAVFEFSGDRVPTLLSCDLQEIDVATRALASAWATVKP